jgi:hypothetical protein
MPYVVTDNETGYCKRWGNIDCSLDPGFDGYTETNLEVADLDLLSVLPRQEVKVVDGVLVEMEPAEKALAAAKHLPRYKLERYREIDTKTASLILENGFEFPPGSGLRYSLSQASQNNLLGVFSAKDHPAFEYPLKWPTIDDDYELLIVDADMITMFYLSAMGTVRALRDSGTYLKELVRNCNTKEEIDVIVDNR